MIVDDVQSLVDTETTSLKRSRAARVGPLDLADWFSDYHRYEESVAWWKSLAEQHRDIVTFIPSIGKTHEGRDIIAIRISSGRTNSTRGKPKVTIQGLQHAREWLAKTTVEFIVHSLVNDKTAAVQDLLDRVSKIESLN